MNVNNPYSLDETLDKLRSELSTKGAEENRYLDSLELLEKAVSKAREDEAYARQMEVTLLQGSTVELRELLSVFGDYMESPRSEFPWYPHHDAVNGIDTAMHRIKLRAAQEVNNSPS